MLVLCSNGPRFTQLQGCPRLTLLSHGEWFLVFFQSFWDTLLCTCFSMCFHLFQRCDLALLVHHSPWGRNKSKLFEVTISSQMYFTTIHNNGITAMDPTVEIWNRTASQLGAPAAWQEPAAQLAAAPWSRCSFCRFACARSQDRGPMDWHSFTAAMTTNILTLKMIKCSNHGKPASSFSVVTSWFTCTISKARVISNDQAIHLIIHANLVCKPACMTMMITPRSWMKLAHNPYHDPMSLIVVKLWSQIHDFIPY